MDPTRVVIGSTLFGEFLQRKARVCGTVVSVPRVETFSPQGVVQGGISNVLVEFVPDEDESVGDPWETSGLKSRYERPRHTVTEIYPG